MTPAVIVFDPPVALPGAGNLLDRSRAGGGEAAGRGGAKGPRAAKDDRAWTEQRRDESFDVVLALEGTRDRLGHALQRRLEQSVGVESLRDQCEGDEARRVGLRRWNADLLASFEGENQLGRAG